MCTQGIDNGTDEQGTKKSLRHGAKSIDSVSSDGNLNVLAFEKCFKLFHDVSPIVNNVVMCQDTYMYYNRNRRIFLVLI